jgi:glycosyltransferase involved in cell wall biosynthesis
MKKKINLLITARMGYGTFEAKVKPLSLIEEVENIYVIRKEEGPIINKVTYFVLPKICNYGIFNLIITPFIVLLKTKKLKPDFLISYHLIPYSFFVFFAGKITNTPFIVSQTGLVIHDQVKKGILKYIFKKITHDATYLNVPGNYSKSRWIEFGVKPEKINIIHSTIDIKRFQPNDTKKEFDFVFVGVFYDVKRIHLIVDAFSEIVKVKPETNLLLVGDGELMQQIKAQIALLHLESNITLTGFRKDTENFLVKSKILVMASKTEGLPCALMEAMSCELVAVVPNVGNISDLVDDGENGYIINDLTKQKLFEKMLIALNNYEMDLVMRLNARNKIINNHSYQSAILLWKSILKLT